LAYLNPIRRANFDLNVFCLRAKPHGRLLEVGCGSGMILKSMQKLGWQVEGVDFDPAAVEAARKRGLDVHLGTLSEQEFRANSFDAIIMGHCIEHVPDPINLLRECYRILEPGGRLVVITPNVVLIGAVWSRRGTFIYSPNLPWLQFVPERVS
jgi:2-polyprenyl-3-methyl-5-hydroxy-6-metoxy-1,4-benzoquinol methylase